MSDNGLLVTLVILIEYTLSSIWFIELGFDAYAAMAISFFLCLGLAVFWNINRCDRDSEVKDR